MIKVEIAGERELQRMLGDLSGKVMTFVWDDVQEAGLNIESEAKRRCPVRKVPVRVNGQLYSGGRLRSSIHASIDADKRTVRVGTNVHYAPYVEYGTVKMRAQPFLNPALEAEKGPLLKRVEETIAQMLGGRK